jgi:hypothetical protein
MEYAQTVAQNRSAPVAVFKTVAEARKWLLESGASNAG